MIRYDGSSVRPRSSSEEKQVPRCRICYEETSSKDNPLIRPCKCSGSMKFIHKLCLQKWRMLSPQSEHVHKCSVCKQEYRITTLSILKKVFYFYALPGVEAIFYSCCITYLIGYLMGPGEEASRAEKATSFPPFTPTRKVEQPPPGSSTTASNFDPHSPKVVSTWLGMFIMRPIQSKHPVKKPIFCKSEPLSISSRISRWIGILRNNKHCKRVFAGQYNSSLLNYTSNDLGIALGMDQWRQMVVDFVLVWKFPETVEWLFDHLIFEYLPILERPIQLLFTGKIFTDFVRLTRSIYSNRLTEYYIPNYLPYISDVKDLGDPDP